MTRQTLIILAMAAAAPVEADAQHLFHRRRPDQVRLFDDTQARRVGDLVTVLVQESTDVNNRDEKELERRSQTGKGFGLSTAFDGDFGTLAGDSALDSDFSHNRAFDGSSRYSVRRGFADQITVTVRRVLPNGNLVVSGSRRRRIAGEIRTLQLSGVVRPIDIRADNTVLSQYIGEFRICYVGDGDESSFSGQGWLAKRLNKWLPF